MAAETTPIQVAKRTWVPKRKYKEVTTRGPTARAKLPAAVRAPIIAPCTRRIYAHSCIYDICTYVHVRIQGGHTICTYIQGGYTYVNTYTRTFILNAISLAIAEDVAPPYICI